MPRKRVRLRPFFSYYGGKHRHVRRYPAPIYPKLYDICAGSAGYPTYWHDREVILVDTDPVVCGVWAFLFAATPAEILRIPLIGPGESVDDLGDVPQEARWLVGFWLGKALARPRRTPSPWMRSGKWPACFWGETVRAMIAHQLQYIRHWRVVQGTYADVPSDVATYFVDPPYADKGKHYAHNSGGIDFAHLADWCRERPGQVIVCENDGADWLPFSPLGSFKTLNRRDGSRSYSREVVYLSGGEPALPLFSSSGAHV